MAGMEKNKIHKQRVKLSEGNVKCFDTFFYSQSSDARSILKVEEVNNDRQRHVERNHINNIVKYRSCRLWHRINRIHHGVRDSANSNNSEEPRRDFNVWLGKNVEKPDDYEWNDVLQIVKMSSSHTINIFMCFNFKVFAQCTVFG